MTELELNRDLSWAWYRERVCGIPSSRPILCNNCGAEVWRYYVLPGVVQCPLLCKQCFDARHKGESLCLKPV